VIDPSRVVVRSVARAAIAFALFAAGCNSPTVSPTPAVPATGSLAPAATAEGPSPSAADSTSSTRPGGSSTGGIPVNQGLLAFVPSTVDGVPVTFDPETSATLAADPSVATDAAGLAVALAIVPGSSAAEDLAIVNVVRLRDPGRDDAWFHDWRDTYDEAACGQAGGVIGNAEADIGGGTVYIGSCAGGVRTYHTRLLGQGIVVSVTALGARRLGEQVMAGLKR
jgi:hypothetical protein